MRTILALGALVAAALVIAFTWIEIAEAPAPAPSIIEKVTERIDDITDPITEAPNEKNEGPLLVFGSIPYWDQVAATQSFKKHVADIDVLSVFWYRLDANGVIGKYHDAREDLSLIQFAHDHNVKVLPIITNLPEDADWDRDRVAKMIGTPQARAAHIGALVAFAKGKGYDGINIDYEFLDDSQTADFTAFINELGAALHAEGKLLKVAIHAQRRGSETRGQDIASLTGADYLSFMTYDQHWETSDPGANAEIQWMRKVLEYADTLDVPMNKILLGVPLDGYNWPGEDGGWGEASGVSYKSALTLAGEEGAKIEYDQTVEAPHFSFGNSDGTENDVWFENVQSFKPKYDLAKEFGVAGINMWKFGGEDERIYEVIQ